MIQWYTAVKAALEQLSGVSVSDVSKSKGGIKVKISLASSLSLVIVCSSNKRGSMKVDDAILVGDPIMDPMGIIRHPPPPLQDILTHARSLPNPHDLRFVVREARNRIDKATNKVNDLGVLRKSYEIRAEQGHLDKVKVNVIDGIMVEFSLSKDYPTGKSIKVQSYSGCQPPDSLVNYQTAALFDDGETINSAVEKMKGVIQELKLQDVAKGLGLADLPR